MKGLNLGGIGGLLGRNAEKIGVVIVGLAAIVLAWGGINALRSKSATTEQSPDAIAALARKAADTIEAADSPPAERLAPLKPLGPLLDPWRPQQVKIAPSTVASLPLARPLVLSARTKRETPAVFPIEQLHTVSGVAVLQETADEAGIGRPGMEGGFYGFGSGLGGAGQLSQGEITPYVIVTGLIPATKQQAEFLRCLGEAAMGGGGFAEGGRGGEVDRNRPVWTGFRLERQERDPARGEKFGEWRKIDPPPLAADLGGGGRGEFGGAGGGAVLPMDFRLQDQERGGLDFDASLPQRVVEDPPWGPETVHPWFFEQILEKRLASGPKAVLVDDLRKAPEDWVGQLVRLENVSLDGIGDGQADVGLFRYRLTSDDPADESAEIGTSPKLLFAVSDRWGRSMLSQGAKKGPGYDIVVRIDMVYDTPVGRILEITNDDATIRDPDPMSSAEGGMGLGFERGRMDDGMGRGRMGGEMFGAEGAEYRSFRFLDRTVEPGKEYRYRVNVSINNPNEGLSPREVADVKTIKVPILTSDFSSESDVARVPSPALVGVLTRAMSGQEYALRRTLDNIPLGRPKSGSVELLVLAAVEEEAGNLSLFKAVTKPGEEIRFEKPAAEAEPTTGRGSTKGRPKRPDLIPTGATLLDFRGEQLTDNEDPTRMTTPPEPLEALVVLPDGSFDYVTPIESTPIVLTHEATLGEIPPDDFSGGRGPGPRRE